MELLSPLLWTPFFSGRGLNIVGGVKSGGGSLVPLFPFPFLDVAVFLQEGSDFFA